MAQNDEFVIDVVTNFKSKGTKEVYDSFKILNKRIKELATGPISKEIAKNIKREIDAITKELKHSGIFNRGFDPRLQRVAIRRAEERISALRSPNRAYSRINNLVDDISTDFGRTIRSSVLDEREGNFTKINNRLNKIIIREEKTRYNERAKNELKLEKMRKQNAIEERETTIATNRYNTLFEGTGNKLFSWFANTLGLNVGLTGNRNSWVLNFAKSRRDEDIFANAEKTRINYGKLSIPKMIMTGINTFQATVQVVQNVIKLYNKVEQFYNKYLTEQGRSIRYLEKFEEAFNKINEPLKKFENNYALILASAKDNKGNYLNIQGSANTFDEVSRMFGPELAVSLYQNNLSSLDSINKKFHKYGLNGAGNLASAMTDLLTMRAQGGVYRFNSKGEKVFRQLTELQLNEILNEYYKNLSIMEQAQIYNTPINQLQKDQMVVEFQKIDQARTNAMNARYKYGYNSHWNMDFVGQVQRDSNRKDIESSNALYTKMTEEFVYTNAYKDLKNYLSVYKSIQAQQEVTQFHKDFIDFAKKFEKSFTTFWGTAGYTILANLIPVYGDKQLMSYWAGPRRISPNSTSMQNSYNNVSIANE